MNIGMDMNTPDTEWRERLWEWVEVAPSGVEVLNCYPESVVAIIEQALSSRDTYWKERVAESYEMGKKHAYESGRDNMEEARFYVQQAIDAMTPESPLEVVDFTKKTNEFTPITNEDNLK